MTELERLTLTTAFLAAVVVAGISLSLIVHVELVTLVVFTAGLLLGARRGAFIGALGMVLYVLANSALRGFPPSPLPVLALQSLGMSLPGVAGGLWRRWWLAGGRPRRPALFALPVLGFVLTALNQALLNFGYAWILADAEAPRSALFLSGMAFGFLDMLWNAAVFAVAGPQVASVVRRLARERGWWAATPVAMLLLLCAPAVGGAQEAASDTSRSREPDVEQIFLRPLNPHPAPLWQEVTPAAASVRGATSFSGADIVPAEEPSFSTAEGLSRTADRWGLGWGRTRWLYDGLPLGGRVHAPAEPIDLPLAWRGAWRERWSASGTTVQLSPPQAAGDIPLSQISLTTGSFGRRTAEFALFRELGPVELGVDFQDREEQGFLVVDDFERSRLWVHLRSTPGRRPDWSLDASSAVETQGLFSGAEMGRESRRLQGSLRGPWFGGETRLAGQWRRQSLRLDGGFTPFGEIVFDGFSGLAEWAPPVSGVTVRVLGDWERRRGGLPAAATHLGGRGGLTWQGSAAGFRWAAEGYLGHQEPFGFSPQAAFTAEREVGGVAVRLGISHEEELPPMVLGVDRVAPENGIAQHLERYETARTPETRSAARVEARTRVGRAAVSGGVWFARVRGYRVDSNPLWAPFSDFAPLPYPDDRAEVVGGHGEMLFDFGRGFSGRGSIRGHDRPLGEVPYLTRWMSRGSLHWLRQWFSESLELDASLGGILLGERLNPLGETLPVTGVGYVQLTGRVDNGVLTFALHNLADTFMESSLRSADTVTPLPINGRTFVLGLTFFLTD